MFLLATTLAGGSLEMLDRLMNSVAKLLPVSVFDVPSMTDWSRHATINAISSLQHFSRTANGCFKK
jgi:hypothetical protein